MKKIDRLTHTLHSLVRHWLLMIGLAVGNHLAALLSENTTFADAGERTFFQVVALIAVALMPNNQAKRRLCRPI